MRRLFYHTNSTIEAFIDVRIARTREAVQNLLPEEILSGALPALLPVIEQSSETLEIQTQMIAVPDVFVHQSWSFSLPLTFALGVLVGFGIRAMPIAQQQPSETFHAAAETGSVILDEQGASGSVVSTSGSTLMSGSGILLENSGAVIIPTVSTGSQIVRNSHTGSTVIPSITSGSSSIRPLSDVSRTAIGVYLTESSVANTDFLTHTIEKLQAASGSSIVIAVKGGEVFFPSSAKLATEIGAVRPRYDLVKIVEELHKKNIYVIARYVAVKDNVLAQAKPETQIRHPRSNRSTGDQWVDAGNTMTIEYNRQILEDVVRAGVDEVNLDYIRYPTDVSQVGIGLNMKEKADHIEAFIKMTREVIDAVRPQTKLGLSTYAIIGWNYELNVAAIGQDVVRFAPLVDIISPMAYPATFTSNGYYIPGKHPGSRMYYLVYRTLQGYAEKLGPEHAKKLRPWIQGYGVTRKNLKDQMQAVFDAGACGYTVWNADNAYSLFYEVLKSSTMRPESCSIR